MEGGGRAAHRGGGSAWPLWLTIFLPFLAIGVFWAIGQPVFSGADEYQHASEAQAVFTGQFVPHLVPDPRDPNLPGLVTIHQLSSGAQCFIARAAVSAACDSASLKGPAPVRQVGDYVSREPPLPALVTGLPLYLAPNRGGFYGSRILTSIIGAGLFATSVTLALRRRRRMLVVGLLVAMTPSALAQWGVLGSSFLEVGLMCLLWTLLTLIREGEPVSRRLVAVVACTSVALVLSRPASFMYLLIAFGVFAVSCRRSRLRALVAEPGSRVAAAVTGGVLIFSMAWFAFAQSPVNPNYLSAFGLPHVTGLSQRVNMAAENVLIIWQQMTGASGWNEYNGPAFISVLSLLLAGAILGAALIFGPRRLVAGLLGLTALLFAIPFVAEVIEIPTSFLFWQGRYSLPMFAGLMIMGASSLDRRLPMSACRRLASGTVILVAVGQLLEWGGTLHRFVTGTQGTLDPLHWDTGWRPPIPALVLLVLGAAIITAAYLILYMRALRPLWDGAPAVPLTADPAEPVSAPQI